jgi:hypothetical protein
VKGIPEFARDPEILPFHEAVLDRAADTLASFDLVAIVAGAV